MKTVGLITEYNPFHNGHAWHLQEAKRISGADFCIVVMSGNFVQRGEPAIIDKYARTKMALSCGADLIIELPVSYAVGSAEYFAAGAVSLLQQTGIVDELCFGSECGEIQSLKSIAEILTEEPKEYRLLLKKHLKLGNNYPSARFMALTEYLEGADISLSTDLLRSPNNILGIEYLKALKSLNSTITPITIKRLGGGYHETALDETISSASAIRKILNAPVKLIESMTAPSSLVMPVKKEMPTPVFSILEKSFGKSFPVSAGQFSAMLHYRLLQFSSSLELSFYQDITSDLADRIFRRIPLYEDFDQFVSLLHTKQYTDTRIQRCLLHILLDIYEKDVSRQISSGWNGYLHVLGFRKQSAMLLKEIKNNSSIPLITKLADAKNILSEEQMYFLKKDICSSQIYHTIVTSAYSHTAYDEFKKQLIIY